MRNFTTASNEGDGVSPRLLRGVGLVALVLSGAGVIYDLITGNARGGCTVSDGEVRRCRCHRDYFLKIRPRQVGEGGWLPPVMPCRLGELRLLLLLLLY